MACGLDGPRAEWEKMQVKELEANGIGRAGGGVESDLAWLEQTLGRVMLQLMDSDSLDTPLLQLPLAQLRLVQALYRAEDGELGETMGRLSERLGSRRSALTQAAD